MAVGLLVLALIATTQTECLTISAVCFSGCLNLRLGETLGLRHREELQDLGGRFCVCVLHVGVG